jgi:hypothetical protein
VINTYDNYVDFCTMLDETPVSDNTWRSLNAREQKILIANLQDKLKARRQRRHGRWRVGTGSDAPQTPTEDAW